MKVRLVTVFVLALLLVGAASATAGTLWGTYNGYSKVKLVMNGTEKTFSSDEVPALNIDSTTVVPLRTVVNEFGLIMNWDADNQTVELYKPNVHMTIVKEFQKKGDYTMKTPFGLIKKGTTTDFYIFTTVDNLKAEVSGVDWSLYSPSGKLVKSTSRDIEGNPESFWFPINMDNVTFDEKGVYTTRLSLKLAYSGKYYKVAEKQIVSE
jgi:hypothetical protein